MNHNHILPYKSCLCALIFSLFLTGCASKYGVQTTEVHYYPSCYKPVSDLRREEANVDNSTMSGAAVGAILGALIGGLSTGKAEGALVGAAAGGAVGAVGGHAYATSEQRARDREFFREYAGQLDADTAQMTRANAAAKIASQCYDREFKRAIASARAGKISKIELTNRYDEIRQGLEETSRILKTTYNGMSQKDDQYRRAMATQTTVQTNRGTSQRKTENSSEKKQAQNSNYKRQATKKELNNTSHDLDAQIQNNDRILEAALLG